MNYSERTEEYLSAVRAQMNKMGVLEDLDSENFKFLGDAVELYYRAQDELDGSGLSVIDQRGRTVVNPAFNVLRSQQAVITALMKELSLSARQRRMLIKDNMVEEETPLSKLLDIVNE